MVAYNYSYNAASDWPRTCFTARHTVIRSYSITVPCVSLSDPENGNVTCPSSTSVFQDTCIYYCNRGYQLEGNRQTNCTADGTWSSEPVTCIILKCNDPEVEIANSQSVGVCNVTYGSSCSLSLNCSSGFNVSGNGEHVCDDVNDEGTAVKWRSVGGAFSCVAAGKSIYCKYSYSVAKFQAEISTDSNSGGESTIPIIAGSLGGAAFFIIIFLMLIVILCAKQSHKKRSHSFDNKMVIELNSDVKMSDNPSYSTVTQNRKQEDQYDYVLHHKFSLLDNTKDAIRMDSNPSYGRVQSCNTVGYDATDPDDDVTIQTSRPAYNTILKETTKDDTEDQHGYVETNVHSTQVAGYLKGSTTKEEESVYDIAIDDIDNVKIDPNPSYESVSRGVKLEDNPSYNKIIHM